MEITIEEMYAVHNNIMAIAQTSLSKQASLRKLRRCKT